MHVLSTLTILSVYYTSNFCSSFFYQVVIGLLLCTHKKPCKTVVFCTWLQPLVLLELAIAHEWPHRAVFLLSGKLKKTVEKNEVLKQFKDSEDESAILLCVTSAGGVGINIVEAQTCIFLNDDWNPQTDMQCVCRLWRAGQRKKVNIFTIASSFRVEIQVETVRKGKIELQNKFDMAVRTKQQGVKYGFLLLLVFKELTNLL